MVQLFLNIAVHGMNPQKAIEEPRFATWNFPNSFWPHTYLPGRLDLEGRIDAAVAAELVGLGHDLHVLDNWTPTGGAMTAITVDHETGVLSGGADPRRDSYAIGR